jgi:signal transduction histidine kinase/CheY-like chemotaxis protein
MARILYVDHQPDVVEVMQDWLRLRRYEVLIAASAEQAIQVAGQDRPDLVLVDAGLPGGSIEACHMLRACMGGEPAPIILISGSSPAAARIEMLRAGAADYVTRPVALDDLGLRIAALLNGHASQAGQGVHMLREVLDAARFLLPIQRAAVFAFSQDRQWLDPAAWADDDSMVPVRLRIAPGDLATESLRGEAQFNLTDIPPSHLLSPFSHIGSASSYTSLLPITQQQTPLGVLVLVGTQALDIQNAEIQRGLGLILNQCLAALENVRLAQLVRAGETEPATHIGMAEPASARPPESPAAAAPLPTDTPVELVDVVRQLGAATSSQEALQSALNEAARLLNAALTVGVLRPDPQSDELVVQAAAGLRAKKLPGLRMLQSESIGGRALESGGPVRLGEAEGLDKVIGQAWGTPITSSVAVPLAPGGQPVGALIAFNRRDGDFSQQDVQTLVTLSELLGLAARKVRPASTSEPAGISPRMVRLLEEIEDLASAENPPASLMRQISRRVAEGFEMGSCRVLLLDYPDSMFFSVAYSATLGWPDESGRRVLPADDLHQKVMRTGKTLSSSVAEPELPLGLRDNMLAVGFGSLLLLPIILEGGVAGIVELYHTSADHLFSGADIERSQKTFQAWKSTLKAGEDWQTLEATQALGQTLVVSAGADWYVVLLADQQGERLQIICCGGEAAWPSGDGPRFLIDADSVRVEALQSGKAVTRDVQSGRLSEQDRRSIFFMGQGSMLMIPMLIRGKVIGMLQLLDATPERFFSESDLMAGRAVATLCARVLKNIRLYDELAVGMQHLEVAYQDLREVDRVKNQMIQNVSHELRTPLTQILGYTDLMLQEDFGPVTGAQKENLSLIGNKTQQITRLVDEVLNIQQLQHEPLRRGMASMGTLIKLAVSAFEAKAKQANIEFRVSIPEYLPGVYIDRDRMFNVLEHLISNAIKFSPQGGPVTISVWETSDSLQVEISDTGIGISPEEQEKIWQRFYQVNGDANRRYGGTGMGLAVARQVIEAHEGKIWVTSEPGKGSTFSFSLPKSEITGVGDFVPEF